MTYKCIFSFGVGLLRKFMAFIDNGRCE